MEKLSLTYNKFTVNYFIITDHFHYFFCSVVLCTQHFVVFINLTPRRVRDYDTGKTLEKIAIGRKT